MTQAQDRRETLARVAAMLGRRYENAKGGASPVLDSMDLCSLSRSLSRIAERACNEDRGCQPCGGEGFTRDKHGTPAEHYCKFCAGRGTVDGKRERRLEAKAQAIAARYNLRCYFQGDPRGAALYLIPAETPEPERDGSRYSSIGTAAY